MLKAVISGANKIFCGAIFDVALIQFGELGVDLTNTKLFESNGKITPHFHQGVGRLVACDRRRRRVGERHRRGRRRCGADQHAGCRLKAAGAVDTLKIESPIAVFAPTDDALSKLSAPAVKSPPKSENKNNLFETYHVVPGKFISPVIGVNAAAADVAQYGRLGADVTDGAKVDRATVVSADVGPSNGVIHEIDEVALPRIMADHPTSLGSWRRVRRRLRFSNAVGGLKWR